MNHPIPEAVTGIVGAIGGILGLMIGLEKSFRLRFKAQTCLCMLQTEINTRPSHPQAPSGKV
ncbi:MAG: hypothetical protein HYY17_03675 [Planctomycetes bacterium]|nr:hypothetical protein [Planctomycetota bacterium]